MEATPLFPGPKFVGPQAERFRNGESVDHLVDYCSSCGTCTLVCPQGVKIAELNSQARAAMKRDHMPLRDQIMSRTTLLGAVMTPVAPIARAVLANKPARFAMEKVIGVHRDAAMPTPRNQSFIGWWKQHTRPADWPVTRGPVVFFHGCAGKYFEVETSIKTVEVLEYLGFEVIVPKQGCCGLAMQSNGIYAAATKSVTKLARALTEGVPPDTPIVSASGSCTGMVKHEAREIMGVTDPVVAEAGARIRDICEFMMELVETGQFPTDALKPIPMTVPYHAPCQLKGQAMGLPAVDLLSLIPDLTVIESGATCCGIAGTYGIKKEKYGIAHKVGQPLRDMIEDTFQGHPTERPVVACDTETCRWQITKMTGHKAVHPMWLVHQGLGLNRKQGGPSGT
jgi:glycerol-3-phosphate dehydrogenase subunit C